MTGAFASLRYRKTRDRIIELILLAAGSVAVFTTVAIVFILFYESAFFFEHVSVKDFITDTMWTPLFADARYGIMPLVAGTLTVTGVAVLVAIPVGTIIAIYLSEFAPHQSARVREAGPRVARRRADGGLRLLRAADGHAAAAEGLA